MMDLKKTDLSKLSLDDYLMGWAAIRRGTPGGTFVKIGGSLIAVIVFVGGASIALHEFFFGSKGSGEHARDQMEKKSDQFSSSKESLGLESEIKKRDDVINSQVEKIRGLQSRVDSLADKLNARPDSYRCTIYDSDLRNLREQKQVVENNIQLLLRPPQTKEQAAAGMYYTSEQLDVFTRQAAEYRKQATDIQEQIRAAESNRAECR